MNTNETILIAIGLVSFAAIVIVGLLTRNHHAAKMVYRPDTWEPKREPWWCEEPEWKSTKIMVTGKDGIKLNGEDVKDLDELVNRITKKIEKGVAVEKST